MRWFLFIIYGYVKFESALNVVLILLHFAVILWKKNTINSRTFINRIPLQEVASIFNKQLSAVYSVASHQKEVWFWILVQLLYFCLGKLYHCRRKGTTVFLFIRKITTKEILVFVRMNVETNVNNFVFPLRFKTAFPTTYEDWAHH